MFFNNRSKTKVELLQLQIADCKMQIERPGREAHSAICNLNFAIKRGCSSVGRAVALQAIGQEFEPPQLHQIWACSSVG